MTYHTKYLAKHYSWGFTLWISIDGSKKMIASKLLTRKSIYQLINGSELQFLN